MDRQHRGRARAWAAALAGIILAGGLAGAAAAERRVSGEFELLIGGLTAGELSVDGAVEESAGRYEIQVSVGTAGFVRRLYEAGLDASTSGALEAGALRPSVFSSDFYAPERSRKVEMRYSDGAPSVRAEPDWDPKPWQLVPEDQRGVLDPLTAVLFALSGRPQSELCDRTVEIFDSRRLFAIIIGPAAAPDSEGEIVCPAAYKRLGGFKPKMLEREPFPFRMVFREGADGHWQIERALGDTPVGVAVLRRKR
ncbi:MAG: DUF3108 domain-containing protein [Pseudomonadota bacterium]